MLSKCEMVLHIETNAQDMHVKKMLQNVSYFIALMFYKAHRGSNDFAFHLTTYSSTHTHAHAYTLLLLHFGKH